MKKIMVTMMAMLVSLSLVLGACSGGSDSADKSTNNGDDTAQTTNEEDQTADTDDAATSSEESLKIGIAMSSYNDKWLSYMLDSMKETAAKYEAEGVEFMYADGKDDLNTQIGQVEDFITNGCDAVLIVPVNTDATEQISDTCEKAGVELVFVNRKPNTSFTSYVGSDSKLSGRLEMDYLGEKMGGKGKLAILMGLGGNEAAVLRTEGFKEIIAEKYPDIEIVAEEYGNWQRDLAQNIVDNWIQGGIEFDAIASNNDEMAIGAILALESAGKEGILVGGIDATVDGLEYLKNGSLSVTVFQNAFAQGSVSVDTVVSAARGETVEQIIDIPYELVPPEKCDEYMAKWGE